MGLTIGPRLYSVFALFAVPVIYLIYSLISTQNIAIDSALLEQQGNKYIQVLGEAHDALVGAAPLSGLSQEVLQKAESAHGNNLNSAVEARALIASLGDESKARLALRALMSKIGDTSGLVLDPDIDSFYVMDAAVVNLPDLVDRTFALAHLVADSVAKGSVTVNERTAYLIGRGGLETALANLASDVTHADRGSVDGSVKAHLDAPYQIVSTVLSQLLAATDAAMLKPTGAGDAAAVVALERRSLAAVHDLKAVVVTDLDRLLQDRVDVFQRDRGTKLSVTFLMFAVIFLYGGYQVLYGVIRPIRSLTHTMLALAGGAMAGGDKAADIPGVQRLDELGHMARTVVVFKESLIRVEQLATEQRAELARSSS